MKMNLMRRHCARSGVSGERRHLKAWKFAALCRDAATPTALGFLAVLLSSTLAAAEPTRAVSATDRACVTGAGGSFTPSFSTDGRFVVFVSQANNLVTNDDLSLNLDVFVRDRIAATTTLVSMNNSGLGGGNADANHPTISSNGQFVAFESRAANLVASDTNGFADIFVRELAGGTTRLVSVAADGGGANGPSWNAMISGDGRRVFFESRASNLVTQTTVGTNIFVRDLWSNSTALVTMSADGSQGGNAPSELSGISADGRMTLFLSTATNFFAIPTRAGLEVFVRDVETGTAYWASSNRSLGFGTNLTQCYACVISRDGGRVGYLIFGTNIYSGGTNTFVNFYTLPAGAGTALSSNVVVKPPFDRSSQVWLSRNGGQVLMRAADGFHWWDAQAGIIKAISPNASETASGLPPRPAALSADGQVVAFVSSATNLVAPSYGVRGYGIGELYARSMSSGVTQLVTLATNGASAAVEMVTATADVSDDGSLVCFESIASNLLPGDGNNASDIFVRDLNAGTTELISAMHPARAARTGVALNSIQPGAISVDGRYALFFSRDNALLPPPTNWMCCLFLTDLSSGVIHPIVTAATDSANPMLLAPDGLSRASDTAMSADGRYVALVRRSWNGLSYFGDHLVRFDRSTGTQALVSFSPGTSPAPAGTGHTAPDLSANGRLIVWQAHAGELVAQPPSVNSSLFAVFLRDMESGTNQLVSINAAGNNTGNGDSINPRLSPDTRRVVFQSRAMDLIPGAGNTAYYKLYARDLPMQTTRLLSVDETGATVESESSGGLAFSGDGRFVAFHTTNTARIFRHEFASEAGTNLFVAANVLNPSLSFDGRFVAYETRRGGANVNDVFVRDLQSGAEELISVSRAGGGGDGSSFAPVISAYGRYVVFASKAGNLVDNDTNGFTDIFVRDRWTTNTLLVSVSRSGVAGNAVSGRPVLAADGRTLVFESFSSDLVAGDFNDKRDVFVLKLGSADTDGDSMDDDWEVAYFGSLARDGAGDFDGDGARDWQEFRAGTDPTNLGSVLRVLTLTTLGGGPTTLLWSAVPGRRYRMQFKDSIDAPAWSEHSFEIVAQFGSASFLDTTAPPGGHRFYRIVIP